MSSRTTANDFWCHVFDSAAKRVRPRVVVSLMGQEFLAQAEIREDNVTLAIQKNILEFNVPVDNAQLPWE